MSTEIATTTSYTPEQIDLLKRTICKGSTDDEFSLFVNQCKRTGLDPFMKQIHAVKRWDSKAGREVMSIQVGIDGFRLIAERTGKYAGSDAPVYDSEDGQRPNKATVTVWKFVNGVRCSFTRSARWSEFVQTTKDGSPTRFWQKMPYLMLAKCAEGAALRCAFPQELSGLYTDDEMGQAEQVDATPAKSSPMPLPCTEEQTEEIDHLIEQLAAIRNIKPESLQHTVLTAIRKGAKSWAELTYDEAARLIDSLVAKCDREAPAAPPAQLPPANTDDGDIQVPF